MFFKQHNGGHLSHHAYLCLIIFQARPEIWSAHISLMVWVSRQSRTSYWACWKLWNTFTTWDTCTGKTHTPRLLGFEAFKGKDVFFCIAYYCRAKSENKTTTSVWDIKKGCLIPRKYTESLHMSMIQYTLQYFWFFLFCWFLKPDIHSQYP